MVTRYSTVMAGLTSAGFMAEKARMSGKSLSDSEREFIRKARRAAAEFGVTRNLANATEEEGAQMARERARG